MIESDEEKINKARLDYINRQYKNYPKPANEEEQEVFDRTIWTDMSQLSLFVNGKKVSLEEL